MNDEELRDYLKRFCFGREHLICSRDLVRQKNLRESDLRKKVNRLRRKAVPIASSREGYFYASNAAELYSTIRQLKEMRAGLDAAILGLEQAMEKFSEPSDGGERNAAVEGCYMSGVGDTSANSIGIAYDAIVTPVSEAVTNTAIASVLFIIAWDTVDLK